MQDFMDFDCLYLVVVSSFQVDILYESAQVWSQDTHRMFTCGRVCMCTGVLVYIERACVLVYECTSVLVYECTSVLVY